MLRSKLFAAGLLASVLSPAALTAEEQVIDGQRYLVTRRTVERPMSKTEYKEVAREVYREEYVTDTHEVTRMVHVPVTEYRWEAQWAGRWNPFGQPYLVQRLVPRTTLETRTEIVTVPVTQRRLVPETRIERVPQTVRWMAKEEIEHKVAIDPPSGNSGIEVAGRQGFGGTKLSSDPPRSTRY
jgi:hypothetical protein